MTHVPWHEELEIGEELQGMESVTLLSVGIDVGTTTTHLMFSELTAHRESTGHSSKFEITDREVVYQSSILLTPYTDEQTIDTERVWDHVEESYELAGYTPEDVDTGAVITTGEAARKENAEALTQLFSERAGAFVCATAGPNLEAMLAAHGSGAIEHSLDSNETVLHIDIGGGTTKFAYVVDGFVEATASINVGARIVSFEDGKVSRIENAASLVADEYDIHLQTGEEFRSRPELAGRFAELILELIELDLSPLAEELMVTEIPSWDTPDVISVSGGVSEYIYGFETEQHGDLGPELGDALADSLEKLSIPLTQLDAGIRATVVGSTQHTMQISGNTITITDEDILPLHNVPMIPYVANQSDTKSDLRNRVIDKLEKYDADELAGPFALGFHLHGTPDYEFLDSLVDAALEGVAWADSTGPLILMFDMDTAMHAGRIASERTESPVISVDTIDLTQFGFVDIGEPVQETNAVPVTIKSLIFEG